MRYTAVFEFTDELPRISKTDTWQGGELCGVAFSDVFNDLRIIQKQRDGLMAALQLTVCLVNPGSALEKQCQDAILKAGGCISNTPKEDGPQCCGQPSPYLMEKKNE